MKSADERHVLYAMHPEQGAFTTQAQVLCDAFRNVGVTMDLLENGSGPLDLSRYEMVFSEAEPSSLRASRQQGVPCFGIGDRWITEAPAADSLIRKTVHWLSRHYPQADFQLPLHWHASRPGVLPPIIDRRFKRLRSAQDFTLVYLPEQSPIDVIAQLAKLRSKHFVVYSPAIDQPSQQQNITLYPMSASDFRHHLQRASRLVCHLDVELIAQALSMGLPILACPGQRRQQEIDARAFARLQLGKVTRRLNALSLETFVTSLSHAPPIDFPDVATEIVRHCLGDDPRDSEAPAARLWATMTPLSSTTAPATPLRPTG